jgi:hypothetical protein
MRIITHQCPDCRTIVAANELERHRVMKCPAVNCSAVLRFDDFDDEEQAFFLEQIERYQI